MQGVESFRRERHYLVTAQQLAFGGVQAEGTKFVESQCLLARRLFRNAEDESRKPSEAARRRVSSLTVPLAILVRTL